MKKLKRVINILSQPVLLNYILPIVMVYLIVGTIAQKYIGLYEATKMFFASPILWIGSIPLPGLPILIGLIFLNLLCKLIFKSDWNTKNAGIIITHIGAIILLFGGLLTSLFSHEGYIALGAGENKKIVSDYHIREFIIQDEKENEIYAVSHKSLKQGDALIIPDTPLKITIKEHCQNCAIEKREAVDGIFYGMAEHMALSPAPLRKENQENMAGLTFEIKGSDQDGIYLSLEDVPQYPQVTAKDKAYQILVRRQHRTLPFQIQLIDFKRDMHPGTNLARSYSSRVRIFDGSAQWESMINMNEPLRYKGYNIYQSSFIETPGGDISVLAVVWNAGRTFPYISGITMCIGMLVHLFIRRRAKKKLGDASYAA